MFIITAVGVFVIKKKPTHTFWKKKPQNCQKSLKTTASFFASACSSLLVMHNLDQTLKIIYKTLAIEEKPAQSFNFSFQCQSHLLKNSLFAASADVKSPVSLLRFLKLTMFVYHHQFGTSPARIWWELQVGSSALVYVVSTLRSWLSGNCYHSFTCAW